MQQQGAFHLAFNNAAVSAAAAAAAAAAAPLASVPAAVAARAPRQRAASAAALERLHHAEDEEDFDDSEEQEDESGDEADAGDGTSGGGGGGGARSRSSSTSHAAKKSRITQACDPCRRRKRKCDGTQPVCSACTRLKLQCSYQTLVKKRGPQAGVVKRLRQEVQALESELSREKSVAQASKLATLPGAAGMVEADAKMMTESKGARVRSETASAAAAAAVAAVEDDALFDSSAQSLSASANSAVRNHTYLTTYFTLLNNTSVEVADVQTDAAAGGTVASAGCLSLRLYVPH